MIEIYFFIVLIWTLFILSLKVLKDFTSTVVFSLLIMSIGVYGILGALGTSDMIRAISIAHIGLGLYWVIKCSLQLNKEWEDIFLKKLYLKRNQNQKKKMNQK